MNYAVLTLQEPDTVAKLQQRKLALQAVLFALAAAAGHDRPRDQNQNPVG
jgi:hypothetical protein